MYFDLVLLFALVMVWVGGWLICLDCLLFGLVVDVVVITLDACDTLTFAICLDFALPIVCCLVALVCGVGCLVLFSFDVCWVFLFCCLFGLLSVLLLLSCCLITVVYCTLLCVLLLVGLFGGLL